MKQLAALLAINCVLALSAYIPLAVGRMVACSGLFLWVGAITLRLTSIAGMPQMAGLLAASVAGLGAGLIVAGILRSLSGIRFTVASLGLAEAARVVVTGSAWLGGTLGVSLNQIPDGLAWPLVPAFVVLAATVCFETLPLRRTMAICRDMPDIAEGVGVDVRNLQMWAVAANGALAALGGAMLLQNVGIVEAANIGFAESIAILAYAFIGGSDVLWGPLLGAGALTLLPELLRVAGQGRMVLYGAALIVAGFIRPDGLWPARRIGVRLGSIPNAR